MLVIKNEIIHSLVYRTIFVDNISYSCQLCMKYSVKNNRNKTNINENYFTELSFPSSIHKIHILPTKKATRTHNGGVYSVLICMYVLCICK